MTEIKNKIKVINYQYMCLKICLYFNYIYQLIQIIYILINFKIFTKQKQIKFLKADQRNEYFYRK